MDDLIFTALLVVVFIAVPSGIIFLFYIILKRLGYPKTGIVLSSILTFCFAYAIAISVFGDSFFTERQAAAILADQHIILSDKFEIAHNKSIWGVGDAHHTFTLKISENDKLAVIKQIKRAENFQLRDELTNELTYKNTGLLNNAKVTANYETKDAYVSEYFQAADSGYTPTFRRISIDKTTHELMFEDIDE